MAFCRVVFPLLVLSVISCYASIVPVYLWTDSIKSPVRSDPFTPFSTDEFSETLKQILVEDPLTLVFIEENLSVEDFSLKNANGETSFPYLHDNIEEAIYLPTVKDALEVLNRTSSPYNSENIILGEESELVLTPGKNNAGRFVFIHLKDAREGESRADLLRRHDAFMQKAVEDMAGDVPIVGIYTANYPSWTIPSSKSRVRRAVEAGNTRMYTVDGLRLVAKSIHLSSGNDSRTLGDVTAQSSVLNDTYVNATLTFDNTTLVLNFNSKAGYWFFDTVVLTIGDLTDTLYPDEELFAILGFCYRCAQQVTFSTRNETKTYTVSFEDLKVQPFFETNTTQEFGDAFNCVGFFSAPIWAGLFVVFILLAITFYGIMMMLDIRTMDRFDDPKGKTITINAE
ncbi:V-type proton ATPase subunit S1 [Helicoverpa zea]|uniref:V-type proton ATPase subunit S1 n=1 Tax=Helicoverpa zea TaxID=7113 RepID=UPI001F592520|nr:V-type proton ATPase subunit S1 [Helicoverpa zea]